MVPPLHWQRGADRNRSKSAPQRGCRMRIFVCFLSFCPPLLCAPSMSFSLSLSICGLALSPRLDLVHPHVTRANEHKTVETEAAAAFCQPGLPLSFAADALRCVPRSHTRHKTQNSQNETKRPHMVRHTLVLCSGKNFYSLLWTRVG